MEKLNDNTKAAIYYQLITGCKDKAVLFQIAEGKERYNKLTDKSKPVTVHKWYNTRPVQRAINEIRFELEQKKAFLIEEGKRIERNETAKKEGLQLQGERINFLNPDEFLKFANIQANEIQDEKERRAYLEMIAKLMNYKDKEGTETEQIKAYLPINCHNCELYKRCKSCKFDICPIDPTA